MRKKFIVLNNEHNRAFCPNWIGKVFDFPPNYAHCDVVWKRFTS